MNDTKKVRAMISAENLLAFMRKLDELPSRGYLYRMDSMSDLLADVRLQQRRQLRRRRKPKSKRGRIVPGYGVQR